MEEQKKNYYAIIPACVRYDADLPANAKLLYGEITALCNEQGFCWAKNSYFSKLYNVTEKTISLWIGKLVEKNYIDRTILYKEGKKEIDKRILKIVYTYPQKCGEGIPKNVGRGIPKNVIDNNTSINNTFNNKKRIEPQKRQYENLDKLFDNL